MAVEAAAEAVEAEAVAPPSPDVPDVPPWRLKKTKVCEEAEVIGKPKPKKVRCHHDVGQPGPNG
eukprot:4131017-Alexandrium_andersonii.AAC.1